MMLDGVMRHSGRLRRGWSCVLRADMSRMAMSEQPSQQAMLMGWLGTSTEGCRLCSSACILLSLIHFLLELFGLLFVDEAQTSQAFFEFEGMKEGSVLVIVPRVENLLVPDNSSIGRLSKLASGGQMWWTAFKILDRGHTEISTILIQYVFPTRSLTSATAPCSPVYVHFERLGYAT